MAAGHTVNPDDIGGGVEIAQGWSEEQAQQAFMTEAQCADDMNFTQRAGDIEAEYDAATSLNMRGNSSKSNAWLTSGWPERPRFFETSASPNANVGGISSASFGRHRRARAPHSTHGEPRNHGTLNQRVTKEWV
ncbi:MAG: hypothetical protein LBV00_09825 [Propionibacteriaceae bacterium]|nr:hypothetical protein [Propionibacteriaceae bacterium]